jgi:antitoxin Phd
MSKMPKEWQLQEAKNKFSQVFNEALEHGAQTVTRGGKEKVLLISLKDYQKLLGRRKSLSQFLQSAPQGDEHINIDRQKDFLRDIAL